MKQQFRLHCVITFILGIIFGIFVGHILPPITLNSEISVYRISAEHSNRKINIYTDMLKSQKHSVVQPYEFLGDMQYILTLKADFDKLEVSTYLSEQQEWEEVEIVDLGNEQYSIDAIPVFYRNGYNKRTVTYCITLYKEKEIKRYYFTTRHE